MTNESATGTWPKLGDHVGATVARLQRGYLADRSESVSALAQLRNGVGKRPGDDVRLVAWTTAGLHPDGAKLADEPNGRELAAYAAITLYAMHQQSHRSKGMHSPGISLGRAARTLTRGEDAPGVHRRVTALVSATSWEASITNARGVIQLLRAAGVQLDYGQFAEDLLTLRDPDRAHWVRNRWGRDLFVGQARLEEVESPKSDATETTTTAAAVSNTTTNAGE